MSENMKDEHFLPIKLDVNDQAKLITADVKHSASADLVHAVGTSLPNFPIVLPAGMLGDPVPRP
jgi:hypothetical protein